MIRYWFWLILIPTHSVFTIARRSKRGICYGDVAGWLAGCLSVTAGIVSKPLNLS